MKLSSYRFPVIHKVTMAQMQLALGITKDNQVPEAKPSSLIFFEGGFSIDLEETYGLYIAYSQKKVRIIDSKNSMTHAILHSDGTTNYLIKLGCLGSVCLEAWLTLDSKKIEIIISPPGFSHSEEQEFFEVPYYFRRGVDRTGRENLPPTLIIDKSLFNLEDIRGQYISAEDLTEFAWVEEEFRHIMLQELKPTLASWEQLLRKQYEPSTDESKELVYRRDEEEM